jgi:hypothetical protein
MPVVKIEPTSAHPVPYSLDDETPKNLIEEIAVAGNTAELQVELGAPLELPDESDQRKLKALIEQASKRRGKDPATNSPLTQTNTAYAAASFLRTYGQSLAFDAAQARSAITAKLMEIADCGEIKYELKALELLGKHSDIGLFTERTEINITYNNPDSLEKAIKERVKRLLNADIIDVTPVGVDLDEELGIFNDEDGTVALQSEMEAMLGPDEEETGPDA